ncbi:hypothetical protein D3C71_691650 [compost metagenome]
MYQVQTDPKTTSAPACMIRESVPCSERPPMEVNVWIFALPDHLQGNPQYKQTTLQLSGYPGNNLQEFLFHKADGPVKVIALQSGKLRPGRKNYREFQFVVFPVLLSTIQPNCGEYLKWVQRNQNQVVLFSGSHSVFFYLLLHLF